MLEEKLRVPTSKAYSYHPRRRKDTSEYNERIYRQSSADNSPLYNADTKAKYQFNKYRF